MRRRSLFIAAAIVSGVALPVLWFSAADWCWYIDRCEDCRLSIDVCQTRVFGYPISEEFFHDGVAVTSMADIATPHCDHPKVHRWLKQRWIGMVYCCCPCHNGITDITSN